MELFSKEMLAKLSKLSADIQALIPSAVKRISSPKSREYTNPNTGEISVRQERYLNVDVDQKLWERVKNALKFVTDTIKANPGNQYYLTAEVEGIRMNIINAFEPNDFNESYSISLVKAYVPNVYDAERSEDFSKDFTKYFSQAPQVMRVPNATVPSGSDF
jgi:hypothetical protein